MQMPDRRGIKVEVNTKERQIKDRALNAYPGEIQQALSIQAHLLIVQDTDPKQVAFLTDLYNRARKGEDVLREHPELRLLPIDHKVF
jgi:hypothetical protein